MLQLIQQLVLIAGTLAGAATDAKTGYIYDWITYPMILIGLILSITQMQWNNLIVAGVLFALLYATYKFGKLGGGDVKLFVGIALLNPLNDYIFLVTILFFAAMSAMMFYSIYYFIKYARKGINPKENKQGILRAIIFGTIIAIYFILMNAQGILSIQSIILLGVPLFLGLIFVALQEGIKKNFFEKKITLKEIEEDEVLAEGRNSKKIIQLLKGKQLIGENEKKLLQKHQIHSIYVLRGLPPFGPFICLGVILALLQPNFFMILFI